MSELQNKLSKQIKIIIQNIRNAPSQYLSLDNDKMAQILSSTLTLLTEFTYGAGDIIKALEDRSLDALLSNITFSMTKKYDEADASDIF